MHSSFQLNEVSAMSEAATEDCRSSLTQATPFALLNFHSLISSNSVAIFFLSLIALLSRSTPMDFHRNLPRSGPFSDRLCPTTTPCHPLKTHFQHVLFSHFSPRCWLSNLAMFLAQVLKLYDGLMSHSFWITLHFMGAQMREFQSGRYLGKVLNLYYWDWN